MPEAFRPISWVFSGRVLPDLPPVSLSIPYSEIRSSGDFSFEIFGNIHASTISVSVRQLAEVDLLTLRNSVRSVVGSYVDLAGLMVGAGLDVDLVSARGDNGDWQVFDAFVPALQRTGTVELASTLLIALAEDTQARLMLADFREAIRRPMQTGFHCYRSVESAMQAFRNETGGEKSAWDALRGSLNVERGAIDRIKEHADWARHGRGGDLSDKQRRDLLVATKEIIVRYLSFVERGRAPLPASDFPVLQ